MRGVALSLIAWGIAGALLAGGTACGGSRGERSPAPPAARLSEADAQRARQLALEQRMTAAQEALAQLERQLAELRLENDRRAQQAIEASRQLDAMLRQLRSEVSGGQAPAPVPALPEVQIEPLPTATPAPTAAPAAYDAGRHTLVRLILVVVILAAIWFFYKLFLGRWSEADDELDEDAEGEDEVYRTEAGTVRIAPAAQGGAPPAAPAAGQEPPAAPEPKP